MHPSIRRAFEQGNRPFSQHPVLGPHGQDLAFSQFEHLRGLVRQSTGTDRPNMGQMMALLNQTIELEEQHREQLERLAIDIVSKVWKAKPDLFEAELGETGPMPEEEPEEEKELTPEQVKEINKRITLNTIIHGASIHQMTTMHHLAKEAIDRIDPRLIQLYDKLSRTMNYSGWFMNIDMLMTQLGQKGGQNEIVWDDDTPTIQAKGIIFPILVHELSKGCVELIAHHGLPKDPETLKTVLKHADKDLEEMFHFFMGPELWRRFLKLVEPDKIPEIIMALSKLEPDKLHEIMNLIATSVKEDPTNIKKMIADLVQEPEEFDVEEWKPEEPKESEFEDIQKIADSISEDVPAPAAPTKPAPAPAKPGTPGPEKPDPYRPPKPAVQPKPKAAAAPAAPTKPAPAPAKPGTPGPEKPDPYRPPKPAVQPKPKAMVPFSMGVAECAFESKLDMAITEAFDTFKVTIDCHPRRSDQSQCKHPECPTKVTIGEHMPRSEAILMARDWYEQGGKAEPEGMPVAAYHGTHPEDIPAELEPAGGPVDLPPPEEGEEELGAI